MTDRITTGGHGTSALGLKYIFGVNSDWVQDIELLDNKTIYYSSGLYLVKYNMEDRSQDFSQNFRQFNCITAICLSPKKNYIAIGRKGAKIAIHLLETNHLRKKKSTMPLPEALGKVITEYSYISFSFEEDRMAVLSLEKEPYITFWNLEGHQSNIKLLASLSLKDYIWTEVKINPLNSSIISLIGNGCFKMLKYADENLKVTISGINYKKELPTDYVCHSWSLPPRNEFVIWTKAKIILVLKDNAEVLHVLEDEENLYIEPSCIIPSKNGFIIGGDSLKVQIFNFERSDVVLTNTYRINQNNAGYGQFATEVKEMNIKNIKIESENEDRLIWLTDARTIYTAFIKTDPALEFVGNKQPTFTLAWDPSHSAKVNTMDICVRKPLVATGSSDKTVKVWDYDKRELVYNFSFPDEIYAISFHPSGFHLAIALNDKIQFINLYLNSKDHQRKDFREILNVKGWRYLKFNNGGNMIAIASGGPPQVIWIYNFYSYEETLLFTFRGHTGNIKNLEWAHDDLSLFSCGYSGMIYKWNIRDGERKDIIQKKNDTLNDFWLSNDSHTFFFVVEHVESLREFSNGSMKRSEEGPKFGAVCITQSNKMIFAGINDINHSGSIWYFRNPLSVQHTDSFYAHNHLGVTKLKITKEDQYLISCGGDGTVILFEIEDKEARGSSLSNAFKDYWNHILVTQQEIQDLNSTKSALNIQLNDEQTQGTNNIDVGGSSLNDNMKSLNEFDKIKLDYQKKYDKLKKEKEETEGRKKKELEKQVNTCRSALKDLEVYFTGQFGDEQDMIKDLDKQMQDSEYDYMKKLKELKANHERVMDELQNAFEDKLAEDKASQKNLLKNIDELKEDQKKIVLDINNEISTEYNDLGNKYKDEVDTLRNKLIKLKNDTQSNNKKLEKNNNKIEQLGEIYKEETKRKMQLEVNATQLKSDIENLEKKLQEKNQKITDKEREIYDLKKRTQELEKYKYVLDFKIKELKNDIVPRDKEIQRLKLQTTLMDSNLKKLNGLNINLGTVVNHLEGEQENLIKKITKQKRILYTQNARIKEFQRDLEDAVGHIQNYDVLKDKLVFMNKNPVKENEIDEDILSEEKNQIKYLSTSGKKLKKNLELNTELHKQDNMNKMKTNVDFIKGINLYKTSLRDDNKAGKADFSKFSGKNSQDETEKRIQEFKNKKAKQVLTIEKLKGDLYQLQKAYNVK